MTRRLPILLLAGLLLAVAPAVAAAREAVPRPPGQVTLHTGPCPDEPEADGCAMPDGQIWLMPDASRFDLRHELGHVFDFRVLTDPDRAYFTHLLGLDGDSWRATVAAVWTLPRAPVDEIFADAYAACSQRLMPPRWLHRWHRVMGSNHGYTLLAPGRSNRATWDTAYGYFPTRAQHEMVCSAIRRVGEARGVS